MSSLNLIDWFDKSFLSFTLTLRTSDASIPALRKLPCGVGRLYTGFAQTSLWRRKPVYRRHGMSTPGVGRRIPALFSTADWHRHARVIEIQTRQQLKNNCSHERQRIFMNKFCIWTPSGQRTCYVLRFFKVTCLCCIFESTSAIFVWRALQNFANCAHGELREKR